MLVRIHDRPLVLVPYGTIQEKPIDVVAIGTFGLDLGKLFLAKVHDAEADGQLLN